VYFNAHFFDANGAIQVSGTFGSRQEEAQRLGRLLRPKPDGKPAHFYTIVTRDTRDQEFSANRQLFLTEQGYRYTIEDAEQLFPPDVIQRATKPSMNGRANGQVNGRGNGSTARASASSPRVKRPRSPNGTPNGTPTR
jgi:superfamily II DNA or RNA helicase